jgi:hypothetical protein
MNLSGWQTDGFEEYGDEEEGTFRVTGLNV